MKKVDWRWEYDLYLPFCPHCNEPAHEKDRCIFCGKRYRWVEGRDKDKAKETIVEHEGFTIVQCTNNHIQIYWDGHLVMHSSCTKRMTEEELKGQVDFLRSMRGDEG